MTKRTLLGAALVLMTQVAGAEPPRSRNNPDKVVFRIGTYDSRAVAVAFVGSKIYEATTGRELSDLMAAYRKAEAEGDTKRVAELKAQGEAQQALRHKQGFSTTPVDDLLRHIDEQLPEIMRATNVDLLVSKWDEKTLSMHPSAEFIDVTMHLIEAFKPNEKQKRSAIEIQKHNPVPPEKMKDHTH
jgi:hypothetical protein